MVEAFGQGHFQLLIVLGTPGLGKSRLAKAVLGEGTHLIEGHTTAFELYRELYRHQDDIFVIDDVDGLYKNEDAVRLLKLLCQSEAVKSIGWHSAAKQLDEEGIPRQFTTRTRVVIIANEWRSLSKSLGAVVDRGVMIDFLPTTQGVHEWVGTWATGRGFEAEVYEFIGNSLHSVPRLSARDYLNAQAAKNAGLDWKKLLYQTWEVDEDEAAVLRLMADPELSQAKRVVEFERTTSKSRATFFRVLKELRSQGKAK